MSATTEDRAEETSLGWEPDELRAHPHNMHALLFAVSEAFERRLGRRDTESRAGRFRVHLARAYERLERINRETGPGVEEGALRDALRELERAYDTIGAHIEGVDDLTRSAGHEVNTPVCDLFYAAGITLEWALTGCRARLAAMEDETTPRENGDRSETSTVPVDVVANLTDVRDAVRRHIDDSDYHDPSWWPLLDALVGRVEDGTPYERHSLARSLNFLAEWMGGAFEHSATALRATAGKLEDDDSEEGE